MKLRFDQANPNLSGNVLGRDCDRSGRTSTGALSELEDVTPPPLCSVMTVFLSQMRTLKEDNTHWKKQHYHKTTTVYVGERQALLS